MRIGDLRLAKAPGEARVRMGRGLRECGYCRRQMMGRHVRKTPAGVWRCNSRWACELIRWRRREAMAGRDPFDEEARVFTDTVARLAYARDPETALRYLRAGEARSA